MSRPLDPHLDQALDHERILHLAKLARITLRDDEVPKVTEQLRRILEYVSLLQQVDTTGVEPTAQVGVDRLPLRPDEVREGVSHELALAGAPVTAGGGFVVPAFVED